MAISTDRRRSRNHEIDEDDVEVSRRQSIKRVKVEHVERRELSPEDDAEQDVAMEDESDIEPAVADALAEMESSESEEESDIEDDETRRKRQEYPDDAANVAALERSRLRRARKAQFGKASDAGVIKSVIVQNFMNHKNTKVEFSSRLNFLVGHNGSGKSAILTAITVALGGKAAITGRGSGLKDLIRKGCDKATIIITMNNSGSEAFKPEIYSPDLIIERSITTNGSSGYKFRSVREGKIHATKKDELDQILEHFNITIDSPLTVLTQDAARTFLQSADSRTLYHFFLHGTGLKGLSDQYEKVKTNKKTLDVFINQSAEDLEEKSNRVKQAKKQAEASRKTAELAARKLTLTRELAWSYVIDKEDQYAKAQKELEMIKKKADDIAAEIEKSEEALRPIQEQVDAAEQELKDFDKSRNPIEANKGKATAKLKQARADLQSQISIIKETEQDIKQKQKEAQEWQKKIEEHHAKDPNAVDPVQQRLREKIEGLETLLDRLERTFPLKESEARQKEEQLAAAEKEVSKMEQEKSNHDGSFIKEKDLLQNLRTQTTNRLAAFGRGLRTVYSEMDRATWHHSKPIGPLGMRVQLLDLDYRDAVQSHLGAILCGFAARDKRDADTMQGILRKCVDNKSYDMGMGGRQTPIVITWGGDRFDFSSGDFSRFGPTILSKLRVEDEDVLRILIVQRNIEKMFLAPTLPEAQKMVNDLLQKGVTPQVLTKNLFIASGSQISKNTVTASKWSGNTLFTRDMESEIAQQEAKVEDARKMSEKVERALTEATRNRNNIRDHLAAVRRDLKKVRIGIQNARNNIDIESKKLEVRDSVDELDSFQTAKKDAESAISRMEASREVSSNGLEEYRVSVQKFQDEISGYDEQLETFGPARDAKLDAVARLLTARAHAQRATMHYRSAANTHNVKVTRSEEDLALKSQEVDDWTAQALAVCPRVETKRKTSRILQDKQVTEKALAESQKQTGESSEVLWARYRELNEQLRIHEEQAKMFMQYSSVLERAVTERTNWWMEMRAHTSTRARSLFITYLQKRGFEGKLHFNHEYNTLNIRVIPTRPNREKGSQAPTQVFEVPKNLSGGERSFSTVALLLSLWDVATCPVRCLDEWDVFLDSVNRGIAAKMLIDGALESLGKQYILITPQDMSGITIQGPDQRIIRLGDPERGQSTLNFAPTG